MKEADVKRKIVKRIRDEGGYGRRFEDQFAVGLPDTILIPSGGPVFFVEAKIIRTPNWAATERQALELRRIRDAIGPHGYACELGWHDATNTIRLRRIDTELETKIEIKFWTRFNASEFLKWSVTQWAT